MRTPWQWLLDAAIAASDLAAMAELGDDVPLLSEPLVLPDLDRLFPPQLQPGRPTPGTPPGADGCRAFSS